MTFWLLAAVVTLVPSIWIGADYVSSPLVKMSAAVSTTHVTPGRPFDIICTLDVPAGWHVYWKDPGTSGVPTGVSVCVPAGFAAGPTRYPRPRALPEPAGPVNAMEGRVHLAIRVSPPADLVVGQTLDLTIDADWLVCKAMCYLGSAQVRLSVPVAATVGRPTQEAAWAEALPRPIGCRGGTVVSLEGNVLRVQGPVDAAGEPGFLPQAFPGVRLAAARVAIQGGQFVMELPVSYDQHNAQGHAPHVRGLLIFGSHVRDPAWEIDQPLLGNDMVQSDSEQRNGEHQCTTPASAPR
jgi:DsbC/DsbD-like thiol-disulfide interchange protein